MQMQQWGVSKMVNTVFFLGMKEGHPKLLFKNFQTLPRSQDGMVRQW